MSTWPAAIAIVIAIAIPAPIPSSITVKHQADGHIRSDAHGNTHAFGLLHRR